MKKQTVNIIAAATLILLVFGVYAAAVFLPKPISGFVAGIIGIITCILLLAVLFKNNKNKSNTNKSEDLYSGINKGLFGTCVLELDLLTDHAILLDDTQPTINQSFVFSQTIALGVKSMEAHQADIIQKNLSAQEISTAINEGGRSFVFRGTLGKNKADVRWYRCDIRPAGENNNKAYIVFQDVEEEKYQQDEIRRRAETDSLTGVYNRGAFEAKVEKILRENLQKNYMFFLMDVDNFKNINDTLGHPGGDKVLKRLSAQLKDIFNTQNSIIGRIGGDEFVMFCEAPPTREKLNVICNQILAGIKASAIDKNALSGSVGVCLSPKDGTTFSQLYSHADVAMYQAKLNGKNQCCFFNNLGLNTDTKALMARLRERSDYSLMQNTEFEENNYLEYIFSTLYKANNTADAMTDILEFTVRYFALSCAYIIEPNTSKQLFNVSYEWCKSGCRSLARGLHGISCESSEELCRRLRKNGVFCTERLTGLPERMHDVFSEAGATGLVLLPLWDSIDRLSGIVILESRNNGRGVLGKEEIRALRLASRVISSFLIQSKSQQLLNENFATTKSVIDTIPTGIYVVDKQNYKLMFYNHEVEINTQGPVATGQYCYAAFYGLERPCENCPITQIPLGEKKLTTQFTSDDKKRHMQVSVTETTWKAGRSAYLITSYDKIETAEEKEQRRKDRRYRLALRDIYQYICEIDLCSGLYQVFNRAAEVDVLLPSRGLFEVELARMAAAKVLPNDGKNLCKNFSLEKLRGLQNGDMREINIDFQLRGSTPPEKIWCNATAVLAHGENGQPDSVLLFIREIEQQKRAEALENTNELLKQKLQYKEQLQNHDKRYKIIVEQTGAMVFEWDNDEKEQFCSPELFKTLVIPEQQQQDGLNIVKILGTYPLIHGDDEVNYAAFLESVAAGNEKQEITCRLKTRQNGYCWFKISVSVNADSITGKKRYVGTILDVDEQTKAFKALKYRAEFDPMTGIYSYDKFCMSAQDLMHRNFRSRYAIISFDIDKFKLINDIYGLEVGDSALRHIGDVLLRNLPRHSRCARVHSDVFCMAVPYISRQDLITLVRRLATKFSQFQEGGQLSAFFGIYLVEDINTPVSIMVDRAHLAKRSIKGSVVKRYMFYEDELRTNLLEEQNIEKDMYSALAQREFVVYLQPKYNLDTNSICGAEALVRWNHPKKGLLAPGQFLPVLERNGFIMRVDEYVWEETCRILRRWIDENKPLVPISVNVSRLHIHSQTMVPTMVALVKKYGIKPELLHLELTETLFFENHDRMFRLMQELQQAGFVLEMDDFGSGYSSLNMLRNVPVNAIKIDKGFLDETISTDRGQVVVSHTVAMAKELHLTVIAEGVETKEQLEYLRDIECDDIQGYYIAKPMPVIDFEQVFFSKEA